MHGKYDVYEAISLNYEMYNPLVTNLGPLTGPIWAHSDYIQRFLVLRVPESGDLSQMIFVRHRASFINIFKI